MAFDARYSEDEREAMAVAYLDRGLSAKLVVELAARGELEWHGRCMEPFETNPSTVRSVASTFRRRRMGEAKSALASVPARDGVEALRRRLVGAVDALMVDFERQVKRRPADADPERLRQLIRVTWEAAALPALDDPRPPTPGASVNGRRTEGATRGGLAGAILKAARGDVTMKHRVPWTAILPVSRPRRMRHRIPRQTSLQTCSAASKRSPSRSPTRVSGRRMAPHSTGSGAPDDRRRL